MVGDELDDGFIEGLANLAPPIAAVLFQPRGVALLSKAPILCAKGELPVLAAAPVADLPDFGFRILDERWPDRASSGALQCIYSRECTRYRR